MSGQFVLSNTPILQHSSKAATPFTLEHFLPIMISSAVDNQTGGRPNENSDKILQAVKLSSQSFQYGRGIEEESRRGN